MIADSISPCVAAKRADKMYAIEEGHRLPRCVRTRLDIFLFLASLQLCVD